jgi:hypothetical protein
LANVLERPDPDRDRTAETIRRWTDHYRQSGFEQLAVGVVVLHRRTAGKPWIQAFQADGAPSGPGGDQLERMFTGGEFLASRTGADLLRDLLSTPWHLVGHRLDQRLAHEGGAYTTGGAALIQEPGLGLSAPVDPRVVPLIIACDGRRSVGELLRETPVPEGLDQGEFHQLSLSTIRDLIARGYLVGDGWPGGDPALQTVGRGARA